MNSRDLAHEEDKRALWWLEHRVWVVIVIAVFAIIASTSLVYSIATRAAQDRNTTLTAQAQRAADAAAVAAEKAHQQASAQCSLDQAVAEAPLTAPISQLGLAISLGARIGYSVAQCAGVTSVISGKPFGLLTAPDPRVAALLPPGVN